MNESRRTARIAGALYVVVAITGAFSLLYVPATLIVPDNAAETVKRIEAQTFVFRLAIASAWICQITFVFLVLALHRLLKDVDRTWAAAMVALVTVSVPIAFLNSLNQVAALLLLSGADFLSAFSTSQLHAFVMFFLTLHEQGVNAVEIFWGLWLFPFGVLVFHSRFLPRILGVLLMLACAGYVAHSLIALLLPQYADAVLPVTSAPAGIGEFAIMFWLLIKGVSDPAPKPVPQPA